MSPALEVGGLPSGAKCLAVIFDDPDAPRGTWTHWTAWNIPVKMTTWPEGIDLAASGAREGTTSAGSIGYHGPCPPGGTHRYFVRVYALDATIPLERGATRQQLEKAMRDRVLASGELMGTFSRD